MAAWPAPAVMAQLISPGELSNAHRDLEGVRVCTRCHELGRSGVSNDKCLACHTPLRSRIAAGRGTHARVADRSCAVCHKEHFGRSSRLVRFEPATFDHRNAGVVLRGAHARAECRDCHTPARITDPAVRSFKGRAGALSGTWLGVATRCASCHEEDDPHAGQFAGRGCEECHGQEEWESTPRFSHEEARYRLTGAHRGVECAGCHRAERAAGGAVVTRWRPVAADGCVACHRSDDPHGPAMSERCEDCHVTDGWSRMDVRGFEQRFDHAATGWPLRGAHADVACDVCHKEGSAGEDIRIVFAGRSAGGYPRPRAEACASCHVDPHDGAFEEEGCDSCHGDRAWTPSRWDVARHDAEAGYALEGAHAAVPCVACHLDDAGAARWSYPDTRCVACHQDPHAGQFADRECEACHDTGGFDLPDLDHAATRFPLDGAHAGVACEACHVTETAPGGARFVRYRPLGAACADCHGATP